MKALKLFWGVSGPVSIPILAGLTFLWIVFLVVSGLAGSCEQSNSAIRKGSGNVVRTALQGNLPELKNALNLLRISAVDTLTFEGARSIDQDVFGNVMVGRPSNNYVYTCEYSIEHLGLAIGQVRSHIDIPKFAIHRLRNELASILIFWLFALVVILVTNYRALSVLNSINSSLDGLAQTDENRNLRHVLARAIKSVPRNAGTKVALDSLSKILTSLAEVAELNLRASRAEHRAGLARQVGHDIRSPLSALRILMEKSKNLSPLEQELLRSCYQRVEQVASDLMSTAQIEGSKERVEFVSCVNEIVEEKKLQHPQVEWFFQSNVNSTYTYASQSDLQRVISNLLNNSLEAHASKVELNISTTAGIIVFSVSDNGVGVPPDLLTRIQAGSKATTKGLNRGLGLSHARKVIEEYGGELQIKRSTRNGIEVKIEIPSLSHVRADLRKDMSAQL